MPFLLLLLIFSNLLLNISYTYDLSNRLLNTTTSHPANGAFNMENLYDLDGNITKLERHGSDGNTDDDFAYNYTSGTNRLTKVFGGSTQFTYDYNGNLISDGLNHNNTIEYDHRNLITKITRVIVSGTIFEPDVTYVTLYKYDDAGNRIRKVVLMTSLPDPEPIGGNIDSPPYGKEIDNLQYRVTQEYINGKMTESYILTIRDNLMGSQNLMYIKTRKRFEFRD